MLSLLEWGDSDGRWRVLTQEQKGTKTVQMWGRDLMGLSG